MEEKIQKARREFNTILDFVTEKALGQEIHEVERSLYRMLLQLGRILLEIFVLSVGTGKRGQVLAGREGVRYRYAGVRKRRYLSIFGELSIVRAYYAGSGGYGLFPLDFQLNLPQRKYSYILQDWMSCEAVTKSFESVSGWAKDRLGLDVAHRPVQRVVRDCVEGVERFMDGLKAPPSGEEGSIMVHSVDCKGIPMRSEDRSADAKKTKDKPGVKRMACLARAYTIDPYDRSAESIVESFVKRGDSRQDKRSRRPEPCHRRTTGSLKSAKADVFDRSELRVKSRIGDFTEDRVVLMDGERALWILSEERFPDWTEILDFCHVMEKLWIAADLHFRKRVDREDYVRERALMLLQGEVDEVIEDFRIALRDGSLSSAKTHDLKSKVLGYFENNRHRMAYDEYLARGLPIATGVIESSCKTLINRRMEGSGMLWSMDGAEAMLKLRAVFLDELWDDFWSFRSQSEKDRLYAVHARVLRKDGAEPTMQIAA
jgi:hypothetical protein